MLRRPFSHPMDIFIQDDSLFMMEAMLPFLDPQIMKPMAIYIKFTEMMLKQSGLYEALPLPQGHK